VQESLLDPAEERAYRLLIGLASASAEELADVADESVTESAEVLRRLEAKGLVVRHGVQSGLPMYRPLPADVALGTTLLRRQESLEAARQMVSALAEEYRAGARRREAHHVVEVVVGAVALRERLRDLQNAAREEIVWFCRANPLAMQGSDNTEEEDALKRGVRYRAIYERELLEGAGELDSVLEGVSWGEEARISARLPVRLAIVDRTTAVCPLIHDQQRGVGEPTAAVIGPGQLLDALVDLFEMHWQQSSPLVVAQAGSAAAVTPDGRRDVLGDQERLLLSLVVSGMPDKSIVTHLGVSRRTVQRRLDRLMAHAGVDTRTALAYQAARRGWV
jgi:DNA-binding CsgD family transcriptional regulator